MNLMDTYTKEINPLKEEYYVKRGDKRIMKLSSPEDLDKVIHELNHNTQWGWSHAFNAMTLADYVKEYEKVIDEKIKFCEESIQKIIEGENPNFIVKYDIALQILKEIKAVGELEL